jgi:uncharacterized protein
MTWPRPVLTKDTEFFWQAAQERRLVIQRCTSCHTLRHPPLPSCPKCYSFGWDTIDSGGRGTLFTYTVVHKPLVAPFSEPYIVGIADLEEGTRLVALLEGVDRTRVKIGMPLRVDFVDHGDLVLPVFRPQSKVSA